ncbi:MAG TPA: patatin-like phospholipase family protein [Nitrososphaeraceae archaeon]|nr:patatin-like phospholipase family protein [Nitrososphaeraceae archaeon]
MTSIENEIIIPEKQTAIVLQGGGALGAYEAGVVKAIFDKLKMKNGTPPSFDIIVGTSIGAITASILVNDFMHHNKWDHATERLQEFWNDVSTVSTPEMDPTFNSRWDYYHEVDPLVARPEAARRFYSVKDLLVRGARNIFGPPDIIPDSKFFDPLNTWFLYDSKPLEKLLAEKYLTQFPLKTSSELRQPRLLLVSVDIQESIAVTFDSYEKEDDGTRKTQYGEFIGKDTAGKRRFEHVIRYNDGIRIEHVLASSAVPIFYKYKQINCESGDSNNNNNNNNTVDARYFWDGILLSNTPLRQLINEHQDFWENKIGDQALLDDMWKTYNDNQKNIRNVPDLDVYIVDIWPTKKDAIPSNRDESLDRMNDIMSNDKTEYDEAVATFVSDYIDFVKQMRNLSAEAIDQIPNSNNQRKTLQRKLEEIPKKIAKSTKRTGERRLYQDLIKGRFNLNKVVRIERKEDDNAISSKWQDFSSDTVRQLIDNGYKEGSFQMDIYFQIDRVRDLLKDAKLNQDQADNFTHKLLKIRRNYLTRGKEDSAINHLQKIADEIQSFT